MSTQDDRQERSIEETLKLATNGESSSDSSKKDGQASGPVAEVALEGSAEPRQDESFKGEDDQQNGPKSAEAKQTHGSSASSASTPQAQQSRALMEEDNQLTPLQSPIRETVDDDGSNSLTQTTQAEATQAFTTPSVVPSPGTGAIQSVNQRQDSSAVDSTVIVTTFVSPSAPQEIVPPQALNPIGTVATSMGHPRAPYNVVSMPPAPPAIWSSANRTLVPSSDCASRKYIPLERDFLGINRPENDNNRYTSSLSPEFHLHIPTGAPQQNVFPQMIIEAEDDSPSTALQLGSQSTVDAGLPSSSRSRQPMRNSLYDPMFERLGVPVDPILRAFYLQQKKDNTD